MNKKDNGKSYTTLCYNMSYKKLNVVLNRMTTVYTSIIEFATV